MATDQQITIVGAGLAGPLLACFLAREGFDVTLYERRGDPRVEGYSGGRSINLALSARGIDALRRVGLDRQVLDTVIPMRGRMLHEPDGRLAFQHYSRNPDDAINSVSRGGLNVILLNSAEQCGATIVFDHRCVGVELDRPAVTFETSSGHSVTVESDLIVGADGAFSAVRQQLQKLERFEYSQSYTEYGYKELTIPPTASGDFAMERNALHIWPRRRFMMIALPNSDRSFTCTLFWPYEGANSFANLQSDEQIVAYFEQHFADAVPLMPTLVEDYRRNPIGSLVTIKCFPWSHQDKATLLGDAAHAIVPFYGQGMNAAFEDCVALTDCLKESREDVARALREYERRRKPNADAIADMALHNFVEMRDHTASQLFLWKKKFQHLLHGLFPRTFIPLYNMVSFTTIPYAEAQRRARWQANVLRAGAVLGGIGLITLIVALMVQTR
jgi:kynurenine 3-monooxygenase